MKKYNNITAQTVSIIVITFAFFYCSLTTYGDIEFRDGVTAEIDYDVVGNVWIYDANVTMYEPAHILGAVVTDVESVLDIYGGQIDHMVFITTSDFSLPEGIVTVYGTDFAVGDTPVDPNTTELFLEGQTLSGVYESGTPFAFPVDCVKIIGGNFTYTQTIKLGWLVSEPDIELSQDEYDFGQIDIDSTQTGMVTVYNLGNAPLTIESLQLEQGDPAQFGFTPLQAMPLTLEPDTALDIEILYSPVVDTVAQATLSITSDDPNDPVVDVLLTGEGVSANLSTEEQIAQIVDDYSVALSEGTILGIGNKKSAEKRTDVFGKMLLAVDELIAAGLYDSALETLLVIQAKCDGLKSPEDFIQGDGVAELNTLVSELIASLQ